MDILTSSKLKGERASSNLVAWLAAKRPHQVGDFRSGFLQKRFHAGTLAFTKILGTIAVSALPPGWVAESA